MLLEQLIESRKSVRTYNGRALSPEHRKAIELSVDQATSPFQGEITLKLISVGDSGDFRPSTYGIFRGVRDFLVLGANENSYLKGGYVAEKVILQATGLGLATCWIAETFKSDSFVKEANLPFGQALRAVIAIGYPKSESIIGRVMKMFSQGGVRKPFGSMFFKKDFQTPLPEDGLFAKELAMLRLAPSALNLQPWRALVRDNQVDFYYTKTKPYVLLDMGIALCHFNLMVEEQNPGGRFVKIENPLQDPTGAEYLISYICQ